MVDSTDMSTPVTRGELGEELANLATKAELEAAVANLATKAELEAAVANLATKAELENLATKAELWWGALLARIDSGEQRMLTELARHARAIQETISTQVSVIDEKYADLPGRVSRLEAAVFARRQR